MPAQDVAVGEVSGAVAGAVSGPRSGDERVGGSRRAAHPTRPDDALLRRVRRRVAAEQVAPSALRLGELVRSEAGLVGESTARALVDLLRAELAGAGPLEPLLEDPRVTDVLVNGPGEVWVDRGAGLERVPVAFADAADVRRVAERLAAKVGRRLDEATPWVDGRLPGGIRLHAVLPPVAVDGTVISLRVLARHPLSLDELVARDGMSEQMAGLLRRIVAARLSFVVTGGTGAGKTTLLSALLSLVPAGERIVLVEDTCELCPQHPHVVRLEGRPANLEGVGEVVGRHLVRQALRMRPDRLVVGEVRGAEVVDLLGALNTGHEGGCGTVHARSLDALPARVEALATAAGLSREAVHSQLAAGLDVVVHLRTGRGGVRAVEAVGVVRRARRSPWCVVDAAWTASGPGPAADALEELLDASADGRGVGAGAPL